MMGSLIRDPEGIEGEPGSEPGLGLLPLETTMEGEKRTVRVSLILPGEENRPVRGYEIHMGRSCATAKTAPLLLNPASGDTEGHSAAGGRIWGTYLHGIFDDPPFRRHWLRTLGWSPRRPAESLAEAREKELDRLADILEKHTDGRAVDRIIGL